MLPGDVTRFGKSLHTPDRQLNDLARDVAELKGLRASPPLRLDWTPAGPLLSATGAGQVLMRLDAQATGATPAPNQWGWTEMETQADGTVGAKSNGVVVPAPAAGDGSTGYAVPVQGGAANAVGMGTLRGDYWEWVAIGGSVGGVSTVLGNSISWGRTTATGPPDLGVVLTLPQGLYSGTFQALSTVTNFQSIQRRAANLIYTFLTFQPSFTPNFFLYLGGGTDVVAWSFNGPPEAGSFLETDHSFDGVGHPAAFTTSVPFFLDVGDQGPVTLTVSAGGNYPTNADYAITAPRLTAVKLR